MLKKGDEKGLIGRYSAKGCYDQRFINQVVQEVEQGLPRKGACIKYELKADTLKAWMRKYGSAGYKKTHKNHLATTVKRSVVRAVTEGRLTIQEAQVAYGVKDRRTINCWIEQFKRENDELSLFTPSMADTQKQKDSLPKDLQADNEALKKALEEAQLKIAALNTLIDVAEAQLKINIRKKPGAKQS